MSPAGSPLSVRLPISVRAITVLFSCLSLSQVPFAFAASPICYESTGLESETFYPCGGSDTESAACCAPGDICYSNGLCSPSAEAKEKNPGGTYLTPFYWHSCTDPTFQDPSCFSGCFDVGGDGVQRCPEAGANAYCCYGYGGCNCKDPDQVITAKVGTIVTTIGLGVTSISSTTSSTRASSTTSSDKPSSTTSGAPSSTPSTASSTSNTVVQTAPTAGSQGSTPTDTSQAEGGKSSAVPIGVGVGVGVGVVIAIVGITFFLWRRRRRNLSLAQLRAQPKPEIKPDGQYYEMTTKYNSAELSSAPPAQQYYHELPTHAESPR